MRKVATIFVAVFISSTVFASELVGLKRAPLAVGEVYKFCDIVIFSEDKISKDQVVKDLVLVFNPVFSKNLEAGGELNITQTIDEQILNLPSSSETRYAVRVKNDSSVGKLEVILFKNREVIFNDLSESFVGDWKEQNLPDGTKYLRTCGTIFGQ
jgi:hypothetical protein